MKYQQKLTYGLAMVAAFVALATVAAAQQPAPLKVANIKGNVYWTQGGSGANTGIIVGTSGVITVDNKTTVESTKDVQAAIAKITPKPVTTAIITHSDPDHVNGLAGFPPGLTIIATENCKKEMIASASTKGGNPQDRLPTKLITKSETTTTIDGVHMKLYHWGPAHTSGDLIVYLPDQKIVFAGDLLVNQRPSTIRVEKNGSAAGLIVNVKKLIALDTDTYVTGHGEMMTKDDVKKRLATFQDQWNKVKALAAQGKSLKEVQTAMGESTDPPKPNALGNLPGATMTVAMYNELTKKS